MINSYSNKSKDDFSKLKANILSDCNVTLKLKKEDVFMQNKIKKILSVCLATLMILSIVPITQLMPTAKAADLYDAEIYARIQEQKQLFKQGEYFAGNYTTGKTLTKSSPTRVCSCGKYCGDCSCNCGTYYSGGARRSYQCYGFACQIATNVFGVDMYRFTGTNINKHRDVSKLKVGDIVYYSWDGSTSKIHAIFVTDIVGDTVYYGDNNASGPCQIGWDKTMTKARLQQLVNNNHSEQFYIYSATNNKYGEHTHSYGSNYLCKTCGTVNPSKITTMSDTSYVVVTNNAKNRKGPYESCDKINDISNGTILTVTGKITNSVNNLWYRLSDGSWIYSEHIQKYTISYAAIADGCYRLKNVYTQKYLIVDSGDGSNGKNVSVWPLVESATEEQWNLVEDSLGFKIHTALSSGRVLNSYGTTVKAGNNANIWNFIADDSTQRWKFQKVSGGYVIRNVSVPSCVLTIENGYNACVDTFRSGDTTQLWIIEPVTGCSHTYDSGVITTVPDCTTPGVKTYSCTKCGSSYTESVAARHNYYAASVTASTCTSQGYTTYKCTECGNSYASDYVSVKNHNYSSATCTSSKICYNCGATSGSKLGHTYTNDCDTSCNRCGASRTATTHTYKTTTTKATLTKNGSIKTACTICGKVKSNKVISYPKTFTLSSTSYTYNGKVKTPTVTVKDSAGKVLTKGTDYTVSYAEGRKNAGTYKVTVKMIGNYTGTKTLSFKIKPIDISTCKVKLSATSVTYNGKVRTPAVTVTNAYGTKLTKDKHYTVTYASGRKNAGTYKVTVKMIGNYTGTKTLSFKIKPVDISKCKVKLSATNLTYNGKVRTPSVTVTNPSGVKLTKDTHYAVSYSKGRKNVGTYKVTVTMFGNYMGTKTLTFKITPPKNTISKLSAGAKKITVNLTKKTTQVTGYQIQYSRNKDFTNAKIKTLTSSSTVKTTLTGLTAGKTYYLRVRTYKTVNNVKYYSGWSAYKYVKTK